jgi:adenylylsulfate kinase
MLIAMAGLPGTGKSALAARLAEALGAVVLSKDTVRAALFPPPVLDYSRAQDDLCMEAIFKAAAYIFKTCPRQTVILDARTFLRSYQVRDLLALAEALGERPRIIECVCAEATARARLERDLADGRHPARNRTYVLYRELKAAAEPIVVPRLVLDTGELSLEECVRRCLAYLGETG